MSKFQKGNNFGKGRPKGSTNKISREIKSSLADFINGQMEDIPIWFEKLNEKDKLFYIAQFMPFVIPKMKELKTDEDAKPLFDYNQMSLEEKKVLFAIFAKHTGNTSTDSTD